MTGRCWVTAVARSTAGLGDHEAQVLALQQLAVLFQDGSTLGKILKARNSQEVYASLVAGIAALKSEHPTP